LSRCACAAEKFHAEKEGIIMAKGVALNIGLNSVDPKHYAGWSGPLEACEADATDMAAIARSKKFSVDTLFTKKATRDQVTGLITNAANTLKSGDIFLLTYSGHGGQLPDLNHDEKDKKDETWCLYDGELVDDELYDLFVKFKPGVRILVFSDSCHSGSVTKMAFYEARRQTMALGGTRQEAPRYRAMPIPVAHRTYLANRKFYDPILKNPKLVELQGAVQASVLLISGCQDNQLSQDGWDNGLFTGTMLEVWNGGKFNADYRRFHRAITVQMPPDQTPNYYLVGAPNPAFEKQIPFTV
jgi:metacaspase-1